MGSGTTVLTGNSNYTGGTLISAGALQLGAGGATGSISGNVTNNGALVFNRGDTYTFGGLISGTGSVTQQGSGTTVLTGNSNTRAAPRSRRAHCNWAQAARRAASSATSPTTARWCSTAPTRIPSAA